MPILAIFRHSCQWGTLLLLAACATPEDEAAPVSRWPTTDALYAAEVAPLKESLARRDSEIARLEQSVAALRQDLEHLGRTLDEVTAALAAQQSTAKAKAEPAAESEPAAEPAGTFAVHLASYRTKEMAREGWNQLAENNPALLGDLEPRLTTLDMGGGTGLYYRLIAGRFESHDTAAQACKKLRAAGSYCVVTFFEGETLP